MARVDLVAHVAGELEQAILAGEYQPGDPLPPEREISTRLGVSRTVVREAIGRLASLGLVRCVHGSGNRVEAPSALPIRLAYSRLLSHKQVKLEHLAALRLPLETAIAGLAAEFRTEEHLRQLAGTQEVLGNADASLDEHIKADMDFHAILADGTGNPLFQHVLGPVQDLLIASRRLTLSRYGMDLAYRHHAEILAAVTSHDVVAATQAMTRHLQANIAHLQETPKKRDGKRPKE